jgi:hypothetical protein
VFEINKAITTAKSITFMQKSCSIVNAIFQGHLNSDVLNKMYIHCLTTSQLTIAYRDEEVECLFVPVDGSPC